MILDRTVFILFIYLFFNGRKGEGRCVDGRGLGALLTLVASLFPLEISWGIKALVVDFICFSLFTSELKFVFVACVWHMLTGPDLTFCFFFVCLFFGIFISFLYFLFLFIYFLNVNIFFSLMDNFSGYIKSVFCGKKGSCSVCLTLCHPMDCSLPGSSIHGIFQARILEWVAISFSRESSRVRYQTWGSTLQADSLPSKPPGNPMD